MPEIYKLYTVKEIAALSRVSTGTIRLVARGLGFRGPTPRARLLFDEHQASEIQTALKCRSCVRKPGPKLEPYKSPEEIHSELMALLKAKEPKRRRKDSRPGQRPPPSGKPTGEP